MSVLPPNLGELRQQFENSKTIDNAWAIMEVYFNCYHANDFHEELWLLRCMLTVKENFPVSELQKERLDFFLEFTMIAINAAHWLYVNDGLRRP